MILNISPVKFLIAGTRGIEKKRKPWRDSKQKGAWPQSGSEVKTDRQSSRKREREREREKEGGGGGGEREMEGGRFYQLHLNLGHHFMRYYIAGS